MTIKENLKLFEKIDFYISIKSTGNPKDFSRKLRISERSLYKYLDNMKELGAPIEYSKTRKSYFYFETGKFHVGFMNKSVTFLDFTGSEFNDDFGRFSNN